MPDKTMADYERQVDEATADWVAADIALNKAQHDMREASVKLDEAQAAFNAAVVAKAKAAPRQSGWGKASAPQQDAGSPFPTLNRLARLGPDDIRREGMKAIAGAVG